jgi:hypothetical protein
VIHKFRAHDKRAAAAKFAAGRARNQPVHPPDLFVVLE